LQAPFAGINDGANPFAVAATGDGGSNRLGSSCKCGAHWTATKAAAAAGEFGGTVRSFSSIGCGIPDVSDGLDGVLKNYRLGRTDLGKALRKISMVLVTPAQSLRSPDMAIQQARTPAS
jgi:hypothetical protein